MGNGKPGDRSVKRTEFAGVFTPKRKMRFHFDYGDNGFFLVTCTADKESAATKSFKRIITPKGASPGQHPDGEEGRPGVRTFARPRQCDTLDTSAVKTVSIRELHNRTGHYVRRAATEPISVTDRGQTVARLVPATEPTRVTFANRRLRPGFLKLQAKPMTGVDSAKLISEDRDGR
jgi:prevent-host-death family protein